MTQNLTGSLFLTMLRQGKARLYRNRETINDLNVFPIPDGDTGDNMYMTIEAGSSVADGGNLGDVASAASKGMLMGARGNSGVILSRIFAGIAKGLDGLSEADIEQFAIAMHSGVREAYAAVSTPVEGTILTVLRESVEKASGEAFETYFETLVREMRESLDRTPDLLPVLKEARVVDSGGAGMLCIAEGMLDALYGVSAEEPQPLEAGKKTYNFDDFGPQTELEFGYCTEFLLRLQTAKVGDPETFDESVIRDWLCSVGESVVCFRDGSIVKVHVHTKTPGDILSHAQTWGEFLTVKIENMTLQHSEVTIQDNFSKPAAESFARKKEFGIVAVAAGRGMIEAFRTAGADEIIEGGQTMNPSAASFIEAFDRVQAGTIFVFPNNSNVIMTARQAASLYDKSEVVVIPSKDMGAGYVAVASLDMSVGDSAAIEAAACEIIAGVRTGVVSRAIRDAEMDGVSMKEGDYLGIMGGKIVAASADRPGLVSEFARATRFFDHEVVLVFSGMEAAAEEVEPVLSALRSDFPRIEFVLTDGGQPVYDYIFVLC